MARSPSPVVRQLRVDDLVLPGAAPEGVVAQDALAPEAVLFEQAAGAVVAGGDQGLDTVQAQRPEAELEHGRQHLGHHPLPPALGRQVISDLAAAALAVVKAVEAAGADEG